MAIYGIDNISINTPIYQSNFVNELFEIDECFDRLIESLDDYQYEEDSYLNESFIEDIKEDYKYFITKITKGKDEMLKQSTEAARQANEYKDELLSISSKDKVKGKIVDIYEVYTVVMSTGTTTVQYTETRNMVFSGIALDFKKILNDILNTDIKSIKKTYKKFWYKAYDIYRFRPVVTKRTVKGNASNVAKTMSDAIADQKKLIDSFSKSLNNMSNSIKEGMDIALSNKDTPNIKWLKKYLSQQKELYKHDFSIMHMNNIRILRQSRACRDFITKLNKN